MSTHEEINLRLPGPTPLPLSVLAAMARPMIDHRGREYAALQAGILEGLRTFFQTEQDVLLFSASGTGGLEAAVVNTLSPGDRVLAVTIGVFGERFAQIAEAYGANVTRLEIPWGKATRPEDLAAALSVEPPYDAVFLTANETSTGILQDIPSLISAMKAVPSGMPLILVDAISALGAVDLPMDSLGIDVLITGSQKVWMAPPGLTMIGVSAKAWEYNARARMPRFYFDFARQRDAQKKGQDSFTPAVSSLFGLSEGLNLLSAEGLHAVIQRHRNVARLTQAGLLGMGFTLFADEAHRSPTVTAAVPPPGVDAKALVLHAKEHERLVLGGGQDRLAGKIIRVGHMGWVEPAHVAKTLASLERSVEALTSPTVAGRAP